LGRGGMPSGGGSSDIGRSEFGILRRVVGGDLRGRMGACTGPGRPAKKKWYGTGADSGSGGDGARTWDTGLIGSGRTEIVVRTFPEGSMFAEGPWKRRLRFLAGGLPGKTV